MARLGVDPATVDFIVISHPHGDHLGGFKNQLSRRVVLPKGTGLLAGKPIYAAVPLQAPWGEVCVVSEPRVLAPGVATIGPLPVPLFFMGYTPEQTLAVHVEGRGIVLIVGCGHPGVEAIVERAEQLFATPIYGIIGGLHYPITGDRAGHKSFSPQRLLGSANPPWRRVNSPDEVDQSIAYLQRKGIRLVSLSAHDSCDWSLRAFAAAFGAGYVPLKVGQEIQIRGTP